jgi:hypothetical protein
MKPRLSLWSAGGLLLENVLDLVDFKADLAPQHRWFKRFFAYDDDDRKC